MNNIQFLTFEDPKLLTTYAAVKNLNLPTTLKAKSLFSSIDGLSINIETDAPLEDMKEITLSNCALDVLGGVKCEFSQYSPESTVYDFYSTYRLELKFESAWGVDEGTGFSEDTLDTWLDDNRETFFHRTKSVLVCSDNNNLETNSLYRGEDVFFMRKTSLDHLIEVIKASRLQYIFIDMEDSEQVFRQMEKLLEKIKAVEDYTPTICLFNMKSKSAALISAYGYTNIMSSSLRLDGQILMKMIEKSSKSPILERHNKELLLFKARTGQMSTLEIEFEVEVNSLSENIFSFYYESEIPINSNFRISCPRDFFITLIPTTQKVIKRGKTLYVGMISGGDFSDLKALRRFVNQAIFNPPKEFKVFDELEEEVDEAIEKSKKTIDEKEEALEKEITASIEKKKYPGKSKLN